MATFLATLENRIVAILESARGQSGLGSTAALRYIPTGRFRRAPNNSPIDDARLPIEAFDRAYEIDWLGITQNDEPHNMYDGKALHDVSFRLRVGFVYGEEIPQFSTTTGSESATVNVLNAKRRALEEVRRIERALCLPDIYCSTSDSPSISLLFRLGEANLIDLGAGKLVVNITFRATLESDTDDSFDP